MVSPVPADAADQLADAAVERVVRWLEEGASQSRAADGRRSAQLAKLVSDPEAMAFTMRFVDRVARPESDRAAAHQLEVLTRRHAPPAFLGALDRALLRLGGWLAPFVPDVVLPAARRRMRSLVGHLVTDADPEALAQHLRAQRNAGFAINLNLLGEAVLGEREAERRFGRTLALIRDPSVDYVSVKISAITGRINLWAYDDTLARVSARLAALFDAAGESPVTFVNLDMEEYRDLDLTLDAFTQLLDERPRLSAGVVLQAYLPDTFPALCRLVAWSTKRAASGGADIKVRLVKGANLAMERVEAELHGWEQAPYETKHETDANYKRCLDWVLQPERLSGLSIGIASHNLFDVAWSHELATARKVADRVAFEMLQGMAPAGAEAVRQSTGSMLLYTPVVARDDFDVAISYLFRRLEENAAEHHFLRAAFSLEPGTPAFCEEERRFRASLAARNEVADEPQRRARREAPEHAGFYNAPSGDSALAETRAWAKNAVATLPVSLTEPLILEESEVSRRLEKAREAGLAWRERTPSQRADVLRGIASGFEAARGDLASVLVHEAGKTIVEADAEICEAIDFARYYAESAEALATRDPALSFRPFGVVAVIPPWNFPVAIPAGGALAALAAGNAVVLKPAPETPRCARLVAELCWNSGVPADALQYVRTPDDAVGRYLVTQVDAVILTGSFETAELFRSWKPEMRLFAETSGKNAIVITPHADLDQAVGDLVSSAFGHAGQKCSAASLAILVGDVFTSERFRRQLRDATESLVVGPADRLETDMGALLRPPEGPLRRALTDPEANWFVRPRAIGDDDRLYTPGVLDSVAPGSWFHCTECFGPVLGLMAARDLDHALALQNATPFGLTGGIQSLDPDEVDYWLDRVECGNAYVNRGITGAIVRRQPFGGWKRSCVGPGAKAGGPNYVTQLGVSASTDVPAGRRPPSDEIVDLVELLGRGMDETDAAWLREAAEHDAYCLAEHYSREHDPSALRVEANIFRYRPHPAVAVRLEANGSLRDAARVLIAAHASGAGLDLSAAPECLPAWGGALGFQEEELAELLGRLGPGSRLRVVGSIDSAARVRAQAGEIEVLDRAVTVAGELELPLYLREQSVSRTLHRYGNLLSEAAARREH